MNTQPADPSASNVREFCVSICADHMPRQIGYLPSPNAVPNECIENVRKMVERRGGSQVLGWAIWEVPGVFLEAEFHAVWQRPEDGSLLDLNPRPFPCPIVTFLPDFNAVDSGRQVRSIHKPLSKDPLVRQYIYLLSRKFDIENAGDRAFQHGAVELTSAEYKAHRKIAEQLSTIGSRLFKRYG